MMPDSATRLCGERIAQRRNATTLVEVLGTLSVLLVLGVSAASILGSITQVGVLSNRATQGRASVERLAKSFRQDIHQASEISLSDVPSAIDLSTDTETVRYQWHEKLGSFRRTASEGETQLSIDTFELPDDFQPVISVTDDLVVLRLNAGDGAGQKGRRWVIEAIR
jgi:hypothetical protein